MTSIGDYAFRGCRKLQSITIPSSVTNIGDNVFYDCTHLTYVEIPNSVTSIGESAFAHCSDLESFTIPNSVTIIEGSAFEGCSNLTSITIPNSVTSIGSYIFSGCTNLIHISISSTIQSINRYAFLNCSSLTSVTIPKSVTNIGEGAFKNCSNLKDITLLCDSKLPYIYGEVFCNCPELETFTITSEKEITNFSSTNTTAFDDSFIEYATLYIPYECDITGSVWANFGTIKRNPTKWDLVDGYEYYNTIPYGNLTINYTRTFNNTGWQALYRDCRKLDKINIMI